ncbi:right-handed parallel beta-helix repeat-containing protein [Methanococcoides methylutens]|uniref:Disaggregatase-related domain-containing protein n=1 Tax=Methanococcoides methylutens MM1 TaxID=1434104 RepID=A0A0E3SP14_METMT|nr:right-handed parallel beta-helix repeat-containing protein [Methanococcoides methylutens]AKB84301.1 hypothetical protein MCMEM_0248 [Methanococcoides methylutens MM1]
MRIHFSFLVLLFILILAISIFSLDSSTSSTVYVATDGSGDYNCDGINDEVEINSALSFVASNDDFTTVHLNGSNTFWISGTIFIGSNTILEGDSDAVIKLVNNAEWDAGIGLIEPLGGVADDITIQGFEIDGNSGNQAVPSGALFYTILLLDDCTNVIVRNMYLHDSNNDGIRVHYDSYSEGTGNIIVYNNTISKCAHDGVYLWRVSNANVYGNTIIPRTNSGIRAVASNHISIYNNTIDPQLATGGAGIQIQKNDFVVSMNDIEIYNNNIHNSNLAGIWLNGYNTYDKGDANVYIHHNIITGSGQCNGLKSNGAGILIHGFNSIIENNVLDDNYQDGISINVWDVPPSDTGFTIIVHNNIVTNTVPTPDFPLTSGYGINNYETATHTIISNYNNVYNNALGNYKNTGSTTDIHVDPLFADSSALDYHLKSTGGRWSDDGWIFDTVSSPLLDAGHPESDYSSEPASNGNRINIGRYGNT